MITKKVIYGCESRGDAHSPYLTRYTVLKTRWGNLCLHVFHRSDNSERHDHPWTFVSLILWNGYIEETPSGRRRIWPGMVLRRRALWEHRVELLRPTCYDCMGTGASHREWGECWKCGGYGFNERKAVTLVWMGNKEREWGFFTGNGWQNWREYFEEKGC